jgi:ABC-2 type transport system ATP-binding protein
MTYQTVITTHELTRDFKAVRALDALTLEVPRGTIFGFLGPNGAGKTTTIRLLLGLLEPSGGSASVLGFDTRTQSGQIREQSGALLEHSGLYERLSAEDNLDFYGRVYHLADGERRARIQELLEHFGLWQRRKEPLAGWSRGMKQKVAVARALLHRPKLIFLDEPTAGLDPVASASLRDDLAQLAESMQTTVFLTTHNLSEAERLCGLVAIVRAGKLVGLGSPAELRARQSGERAEIFGRGFSETLLAGLVKRADVRAANLRNAHLEIDLQPGSEFSAIVAYLVGQGAQVEEIRRGKASLEEVFLDLVEDTQDAQGAQANTSGQE